MATKNPKLLWIAAAFLLLAQGMDAQTIRYISDLDRVLASLDSIESPGLFRTAFGGEAPSTSAAGLSPGIELLPAETYASYNSTFPFGSNDGALWQGRGFNGFARAGARLAWQWGSLSLQPEYWVAQNQEYPLAPASPIYSDYGGSLDRVQAYGAHPYGEFSAGQSELRLAYKGFTLGFGTKNRKFGPSEIQNLLLSDNAAGFPMLDIGTDGPLRTVFGAFDARFLWAQTRTSEFFFADGSVQTRFLTGGLVSYSAPFLPGMSFGFQRVFHSPWSTLNAWKAFQFFDDTIWKNYRSYDIGIAGQADDIDQILSMTWEWRIPQTGSRAYVEWGRNDHAANLQDFLMQPDHSYGYVAGLQQKMVFASDSTVLLTFEMADIGNTIGTILRSTGSWYRHLTGGYTNDGQLLGAYMGPGSNTQQLDLYYRGGSFYAGLGLQRWLYDADYYYSLSPMSPNSYLTYFLMLSGTIRAGIALGGIEFGGAVTYTRTYDYHFVVGNEPGNWRGELACKLAL